MDLNMRITSDNGHGKGIKMHLYVIESSLSAETNNTKELLLPHHENPHHENHGLRTYGPWLEPPETFSDYNRYFGMNVERIRREAKMNREFLASLACISRSTLARIERGGGDPRLSSMCNLSQALETTVLDLLSAPPRVSLRKR